MRERWLASLLAVGVLVLVGCTSPRAGGVGQASAVSTDHVDMPPSYGFEPATVQVRRGATVTWTNSDNFTHSVQVAGQSDVHIARPGESVQITFAQTGTYAYVCTFHTQNMRGTVVVS